MRRFKLPNLTFTTLYTKDDVEVYLSLLFSRNSNIAYYPSRTSNAYGSYDNTFKDLVNKIPVILVAETPNINSGDIKLRCYDDDEYDNAIKEVTNINELMKSGNINDPDELKF